jgi:SAM-dependent methyltransferase
LLVGIDCTYRQETSTMSAETPVASRTTDPSPLVAKRELFVISFLVLFLELACIRWFPAHVLFLTFFTNTVLLATFLGMSLGCLAADRRRNLLVDTPALLLVSMIAAQAVGLGRNELETVLRVGNQPSPQVIFFGTEYSAQDPAHFVIPIEVVEAFFFLIVALVMVGPGQELGRAFKRVPGHLQAYTLNILGSLAGILLFALASWLELSPLWWFTVVVVMMGYFLLGESPFRARATRVDVLPAMALVLAVAFWTSGIYVAGSQQVRWSPYYRIDYDTIHGRQILVNLIGHQNMVSRDDDSSPSLAYALPHLLRRDSGGPAFDDVLVIGAGSGNDVSRALDWGARHVDAVEIDPVIQRLGAGDHPDRPYQDPRVTVHIADGRNFLRESRGKYDLVVFALVDSLVLHSTFSNIRLESFMFTREALADARQHLKPGGVFVMYNYFRQGWIVARLDKELQEAFGAEPLVLTLPFVDKVLPDSQGGFTMLLSGDLRQLKTAFDSHPTYWLASGKAASAATPNGFEIHPDVASGENFIRIGPALVVPPANLLDATDDWPFLYLRQPMIPDLSLRGMAIIGVTALALFVLFQRVGGRIASGLPDGRMFFLGAAFMLVETKAVVHMALLFGGTWMVNTIVFAGVLVMILAANLYASRVRPLALTPYYAALFVALAVNLLVPLDALLGLARIWQVAAAILLAFSPVLFAGVIFATTFGRSRHPDRDFGANVAGALVGGIAENTSMLLGFQRLAVVIVAFYALAAVLGRKKT